MLSGDSSGSYFSSELYVMTTPLNRLNEMVELSL